MNQSGLSVVIPAYNEEQGLPKTLGDLKAQLDAWGGEYEILVIDDCSQDKTGDVAAAGGATVHRNHANMGYGFTLKTGIGLAKHEHIFIVDADNTYDLSKLAEHLKDGLRWDMTVGVRKGLKRLDGYFKGMFRWLIIALLEFATGATIPDMNSGYRIFRKSLYERYKFILPNGFSFSTSLTLNFILNMHSIRYLEIDYFERTGVTKVRKLQDALRLLQYAFEIVVFNNPTKVFLLIVAFNVALLPLYALLRLIFAFGTGFLVFNLLLLTSELIIILGCILVNQKNARNQALSLPRREQ